MCMLCIRLDHDFKFVAVFMKNRILGFGKTDKPVQFK